VAAAQLALSNQLKPGSLQVIRLETFLRRHGAIDKSSENIARHVDYALVLADADAELDGLQVWIPPRVLGKAEEHGSAAPMRVPGLFELKECAERRVMSSPRFGIQASRRMWYSRTPSTVE